MAHALIRSNTVPLFVKFSVVGEGGSGRKKNLLNPVLLHIILHTFTSLAAESIVVITRRPVSTDSTQLLLNTLAWNPIALFLLSIVDGAGGDGTIRRRSEVEVRVHPHHGSLGTEDHAV